MTANNTLLDAVKKLKKADDAYYNSESPLMEDADYDTFREKVYRDYIRSGEKIEKVEDYFSQVRAEVRKSKRSEALPVVLGSLKKVKSFNEIKNFLESVKKSIKSIPDKTVQKNFSNTVSFIVSPKLDGLTFVLVYDKGNFVAAYSGGDGVSGQLKTEHGKLLIKNGVIPKTIPHKNKRIIIGEIIFSKANFAKVKNEKLKEARNAASGWVNADEPDKVLSKAVSFIAYDIKLENGIDLGTNKDSSQVDFGATKKANKLETLKRLKSWGFSTYVGSEVFCALTIAEHNEVLQKTFDSFLKKIAKQDYELDGIVLEVSDSKIRQHIGTDRHGTPKYAVAIKQSAEDKIDKGEGEKTKVVKIEVATSKSGALKPTLVYEKIKIGNSNYERATGNNFRYLAEHGIGVGTKIKIIKAGDVIPKAFFADKHKADKKDIFVKRCECGAKAVAYDNLPDMYCELGKKCDAAKYQQFVFAIKQLKIVGLGVKNLRKIFDAGYKDVFSLAIAVQNKKDLKKLSGIEGFGESMIVTLKSIPDTLKKLEFNEVMLLSNIFSRAGLSLAKAAFSDNEKALKKFTKKGKIKLSTATEMLGKEKGKLLEENFDDWCAFYEKFTNLINGKGE